MDSLTVSAAKHLTINTIVCGVLSTPHNNRSAKLLIFLHIQKYGRFEWRKI